MFSRALRGVGLLLLLSSAAAAQSQQDGRHEPAPHCPTQPAAVAQPVHAGAQRWSANAQVGRGPARSLSRDASGRVWSNVELGAARSARAVDGTVWTTHRANGWSYSSSSDGTRCASQRTAHSVFISCY